MYRSFLQGIGICPIPPAPMAVCVHVFSRHACRLQYGAGMGRKESTTEQFAVTFRDFSDMVEQQQVSGACYR
jgi:hypothetical protein